MLYKIKVRKEHLKEFFENFDARKMGLKILFAKENCNYKTKRKQEKVYITDELYAILSIDKNKHDPSTQVQLLVHKDCEAMKNDECLIFQADAYIDDQTLRRGKVGGLEYVTIGPEKKLPWSEEGFVIRAVELTNFTEIWLGWETVSNKADYLSAPDFLSDKSEEELIEEMKLKNR